MYFNSYLFSVNLILGTCWLLTSLGRICLSPYALACVNAWKHSGGLLFFTWTAWTLGAMWFIGSIFSHRPAGVLWVDVEDWLLNRDYRWLCFALRLNVVVMHNERRLTTCRVFSEAFNLIVSQAHWPGFLRGLEKYGKYLHFQTFSPISVFIIENEWMNSRCTF